MGLWLSEIAYLGADDRKKILQAKTSEGINLLMLIARHKPEFIPSVFGIINDTFSEKERAALLQNAMQSFR